VRREDRNSRASVAIRLTTEDTEKAEVTEAIK